MAILVYLNRKLIMLISVTLALMFAFSLSAANAYDYDKGKSCFKGREYHQKGLDDKFEYKASLFLGKKEELGLSDEQVEAIKELKLKVSKDLIMKEAEIEVIGLDIKTAVHKDSVDLEAINGLIDKKYEIKKAKAKLLVKSYAELKGILTKAQKDKLKNLWKEKKEKKGSSKH